MLRRFLIAAGLVPMAACLWQCDTAKPKGPSPYAVTVRIAFTPMARAAMDRTKDDIDVNGYYYGDPTPQALAKADALHRLVLLDESASWPGNITHVTLTGNIDTSQLSNIRGEPQLLVTAYSVTDIKAQDELIHCKTWIGTVKNAQARPPLIACELETGDTEDADALIAADAGSSDSSSSSSSSSSE